MGKKKEQPKKEEPKVEKKIEKKTKKKRSRTESYTRYLKIKSKALKVPVPNKEARAVLEQFIDHILKNVIHHTNIMLKDGKHMVNLKRLDLALASYADTHNVPNKLRHAVRSFAHSAVEKMGDKVEEVKEEKKD